MNATTGKEEFLPLVKYVDIVSFIRLLFGSFDTLEKTIVVFIILCWIAYIVFFLKVFRSNSSYRNELGLVFIIAWSTVINIYFPIYDTILVVLCLIIMLDKQQSAIRTIDQGLQSGTRVVLLLAYLVPWITNAFAPRFKVQLYTLVLVTIGIYIGSLVNRIRIQNDSKSAVHC